MFYIKKPILILSMLLLASCSWGQKEPPPDINTEIQTHRETQQKDTDFTTYASFIETGEYQKVIDFYEDTSDRSLKETILYVKALLRQGNAFYDEETYAQKALEVLQSLDENVDVYYYTGYAYEIMRQYDTALEWYEKILLLIEDDSEQMSIVYNQIGHIYDLMGNMQQAHEYYLQAYELDAKSEDILVNLGRVEVRLGNMDTASEYFLQVIEMTKNTFLSAEMYFNLSSIALDQEKSKEEIFSLTKKGIQANPNYPYNYFNEGMVYFGEKDYDYARTSFQKVLSLHPNSSNAYQRLGIMAYIQEDLDNALLYFSKQAEVAQKDTILMQNKRDYTEISAQYDIARVYALKKNVEKTIEILNELILEKEDTTTHYWFTLDFQKASGPFHEILTDPKFLDQSLQYLQVFNQ